MSDYFAERLLDELDDKPALEAAWEALLASRAVGFDYADDEEAGEHFESEAKEVIGAFRNESRERLVSESGDLIVILSELIRRRDSNPIDVTRESTRKFLRRLKFVEDKMKREGKTWADVGSWKDDVKPNYWDEAKKAGL